VTLNVCRAEDAAAGNAERLSEELKQFWRDVLPIMDGAAESSGLHNVAKLSCLVDELLKQQPQSLPAAADDSDEPTVYSSPVVD